MDIFTREKRSELMRRVKNKNTNIELIIRKELFRRGYRFSTNTKLFGKPDIVLTSKKVVIFCDGDFWHGKNKNEISKYEKFWREKILTNIERDKLVNITLRKDGWKVLRFWKNDILKNPEKCVEKIEKYLLS